MYRGRSHRARPRSPPSHEVTSMRWRCSAAWSRPRSMRCLYGESSSSRSESSAFQSARRVPMLSLFRVVVDDVRLSFQQLFCQDLFPPLRAFLRGRLLDACRDGPHVTRRIHDPGDPVAPELVLEGNQNPCPTVRGSFDDLVYIGYVHEDDDWRGSV